MLWNQILSSYPVLIIKRAEEAPAWMVSEAPKDLQYCISKSRPPESRTDLSN